jgi:hypothetical protein
MLSQLFELAEVTVHRPDEVPWEALPERAVLQLHWTDEPGFVSLLERHGFRVIVAARHPLDTLISVLVFSQHDDSTLHWLGGSAGNERCLAGASPTSDAFLNYATGPRAKALLGVSAQWWTKRNVCRVRYEDLVHDTAGQLSGLSASLGVPMRKTAEQVAEHATPDHMRSHSIHMLYHVWQAQVGLWKQFLPAHEAQRICDAHPDVLRTLGYTCDPETSLETRDAQAAWERFDVAGLKRTMHGVKKALCEAAGQRADLETLARQVAELQRQRADVETLTRQISALQLHNAALERQLAGLPVEHLRKLATVGPWSLGAARTLQIWSQRCPRLASTFKSLARLVFPP